LAEEIPSQLISQLAIGGKIILPLRVNKSEDYLFLITKLTKDKIEKKQLIEVRFVPLR
jgi:protein-L-isoaspartate O-methyltransferase